MEKKQNTEKGNSQMVSEPAFEYDITIPITVPTMGGYTLEELTRELTEFARNLVMQNSHTKEKGKDYSPRLQKIRDLSQNLITRKDINEDKRLEYLLNK